MLVILEQNKTTQKETILFIGVVKQNKPLVLFGYYRNINQPILKKIEMTQYQNNDNYYKVIDIVDLNKNTITRNKTIYDLAICNLLD